LKPIIGITGNFDLEENLYFLAESYPASIIRAGAAAIILPPEERLVNDYIKNCHGILLSGGGDIDPAYWNEPPSWALGNINPRRDRFEIQLARKCLDLGLPLFGICRGCQILNVAMGGSLIQDIRSRLSHQQKAPRNYAFHDIFIDEDSYLFKILGKPTIKVNSFHHQAIKKVGTQLTVSARAEENIIEAVELRDHPFAIGVQWHPECMEDANAVSLFKAFVEQAAIYQHRLYSKITTSRTPSREKS
jgi:putative glutamine amidotransferase